MTTDPGSYFEHGADIGVCGRGDTVEEAFAQAARAMFGIAANPEQVRRREIIGITFEEEDLELALVMWLNGLLSEAAARGLALAACSLKRDGARWTGSAWGERWHPGIDRGVEVKGATLTCAAVSQTEPGTQWEARCVVDV